MADALCRSTASPQRTVCSVGARWRRHGGCGQGRRQGPGPPGCKVTRAEFPTPVGQPGPSRPDLGDWRRILGLAGRSLTSKRGCPGAGRLATAGPQQNMGTTQRPNPIGTSGGRPNPTGPSTNTPTRPAPTRAARAVLLAGIAPMSLSRSRGPGDGGRGRLSPTAALDRGSDSQAPAENSTPGGRSWPFLPGCGDWRRLVGCCQGSTHRPVACRSAPARADCRPARGPSTSRVLAATTTCANTARPPGRAARRPSSSPDASPCCAVVIAKTGPGRVGELPPARRLRAACGVRHGSRAPAGSVSRGPGWSSRPKRTPRARSTAGRFRS